MDQQPRNIVKLSIPSVLGYERIALATVEAMAQRMGFTPEKVDALKTAVSEACLNAIEHGNKQDASLNVLVTFIPTDSDLQIEVLDQGKGLVEEPKRPRIEDKIAGKDHSRGWGLFLIEHFVDEMVIERQPEGGNKTRLLLHLRP